MNDLLRQKLEILIQEVTELSEDLMPTGTTPIDMYAAEFSGGATVGAIRPVHRAGSSHSPG